MDRSFKKILIIRLSSLGDLVLVAPVLENLRGHFPNAELALLCKRAYADLYRHDSRVDRVIIYDEEKLTPQAFDLVFDLHRNFRSWIFRRQIRGSKVFLYPKRRLARQAMIWLKRLPVSSIHTVDLYLRALGKAHIPTPARIPQLPVSEEARRSVRSFLVSHFQKIPEMLIGLAPGARWETKRWFEDRFRAVAQHLIDHYSAYVLLVGSADEELLLRRIASSLDPQKSVVAAGFALRQVAALCHLCRVLISNDSGLLHLAGAVNTATVAIYGPTHPRLGFAPLGLTMRVVRQPVYCSPCSLHGKRLCYRDQRYCMQKIMPEQVVQAVEELMAQKNSALGGQCGRNLVARRLNAYM